MAFKLTELIVESVIRDGLKIVKETIGQPNDAIADIFGEMVQPHLAHYFGQKEINKITEMVANDTIHISQGYALPDVKTPLVSINLASNVESEQYSGMDDFVGEVDTEITPTVIVPSFNATSYNATNGFIDVEAAAPDLSNIHVGHVFVDGDGNTYPIVGGINNTVGTRHFAIDRDQEITNLVGCIIQATTNVTRKIIRGIREQELITLTIMTQNQLLTKYLYILIKYILLSNKETLIERGLELTSYDGTDFSRSEHLPNNVFARFLTLRSGHIEHTWSAESVTPFGYSDPGIHLQRDEFPREDEEIMTIDTTCGLGDDVE